MRARLVNETFQEKSDPIEDLGIGVHFEDGCEAAEYVKNNLKEITGFDKIVPDPKNDEMMHPKLIKRLKKWYTQHKSIIPEGEEESFWYCFVDWEALLYGIR